MDLKWPDSFLSILPKLEKATFKFLNKSHIHISLINIDNRKILNFKGKSILQWNNLDKKEQVELVKDIPIAFEKQKIPVLDAEKEQLAVDISKQINTAQVNDVISYFEGKIPNEDLYVLRAAIYIKGQFDKGCDVESLKNSVVSTHGKRGRNICNLYSAGYFETWIKPLYENLASMEDFTKEKFLEAYNLVVEHFPFAIFVHRGMAVSEIENEVERKIAESQKYGIETLNIHGIGSDNILNITEVVKKIKKKYKFEIKIEEKSGLFVVKISITK